jgi:iron-sulfur cluster repair protein YtfE (RIC family)
MHLSTPSHPAADKSRSEPKDVLQLLLASQEQIRRFTALALQLGQAHGASLTELSGTADRVARYFTQRMPRHFEAEDFALLPRLFTTTISAEMMRHLWGLKLQHEAIEQALGELVPLWLALRDSPERYAELAESLAHGGRQLMLLVEVHIHMEEQYLFPLVRACLPQEALQELAAEVLHGRDLLN